MKVVVRMENRRKIPTIHPLLDSENLFGRLLTFPLRMPKNQRSYSQTFVQLESVRTRFGESSSAPPTSAVAFADNILTLPTLTLMARSLTWKEKGGRGGVFVYYSTIFTQKGKAKQDGFFWGQVM